MKSAHAGNGVLAHLATFNERRRRTGLRDQLVTHLLSRFNRAAVDLSTGVVLLLAVPATRRGDFTVGEPALLGLLPMRAGTVYWNDDVVLDRAAVMVPPRSAYVPQVPRLFSESLRDNLLLGRAGPLSNAVRTAVLDRDVASMAFGLETEVGARGVRLSGGQVQRAAIARADQVIRLEHGRVESDAVVECMVMA